MKKVGCLSFAFGFFLGIITLGGAMLVFGDYDEPTTAAAPAPVQPVVQSEPVVQDAPVVVEAQPEPTATNTPAPTNPGVGDTVQVGDILWRVNRVEDMGNRLVSDNQFRDDAVTEGRFVLVNFRIENVGSEMRSYTGLNLKDDRDRSFVRYSGSFGYLPDGEDCSILQNINPGISRTCSVIFEIAADATGLKAHVGGMRLFNNPEALIELGF